MNYMVLADWVAEKVDELVAMGVPRHEAGELMKSVEYGAIAAEAAARCDSQFLLDLKRSGAAVMAIRSGTTRQAVHKRKTKINRQLSARLTTG